MTDIALQNDTNLAASTAAVLARLGHRSIVLVGMMGAGKSSVGRRLAARLGVPFVDADMEIEKAAGMSIADIFARHGEPSFRSGEARVIARLLEAGPQVLATGGGAFMNPDTRAAIAAKGVSVWLAADLDVLLRRLGKRRSERPLLQTADPAETLRQLAGAARAGLRAGRHHRAIARRGARCHRGRHRGSARVVPVAAAMPAGQGTQARGLADPGEATERKAGQ